MIDLWYCRLSGELNEDMENSGEATTCTLDKSKDNLGEKESGTAAYEHLIA